MAYTFFDSLQKELKKAHKECIDRQEAYDSAHDANHDYFNSVDLGQWDTDDEIRRNIHALDNAERLAHREWESARLYLAGVRELAEDHIRHTVTEAIYSPEFLAKHNGKKLTYKKVLADIASHLPDWISVSIGDTNHSLHFSFDATEAGGYHSFDMHIWCADFWTSEIDGDYLDTHVDPRADSIPPSLTFAKLRTLCRDAHEAKYKYEQIKEEAQAKQHQLCSKKSGGLHTLYNFIDGTSRA